MASEVSIERDSHGRWRYWADGHPVIEVLATRRLSALCPAASSDGFRVGLAVEGGGMRGIVSGAMLCAFKDLGYSASIDAVYGVSAGAINAAYFFGGECAEKLSLYYQVLASRSFVDFRRVLHGRSMVDMDYLFGKVIGERYPFDYDAIVKSKIEFHVGVSNVDDMIVEDASDFSSRQDLTSTLQASSWMPVASFRTTTWRGKRALDGAVLAGHPLRLAVADGCTHILSLSTRPIRPAGFCGSRSAQAIGAAHLERLRRGLGAKYLSAVNDYWLDKVVMHEASTRPENGPYVLDLALLPVMPQLGYLESDPLRLIDNAINAYAIAYTALSPPASSALEEQRALAARALGLSPELKAR